MMPSIYTISIDIVKEVEAFIVANRTIPKFLDWPIRRIAFPLGLVVVGGSLNFKVSLKLFFMCLLLALFGFGFTSEVILFSSSNFTAAIGFSVFVLLFPTPSAYCNYGVDDYHVNKVIEILKSKRLVAKGSLQTVRKNVEIFETRVRHRVVFLRSFLALLWAVFLFVSAKVLDKIIEKNAQDSPIDLGGFLFFLFFLFLAYVAIESYSKGSSLLFKSIQFGLNEFEVGGDKTDR